MTTAERFHVSCGLCFGVQVSHNFCSRSLAVLKSVSFSLLLLGLGRPVYHNSSFFVSKHIPPLTFNRYSISLSNFPCSLSPCLISINLHLFQLYLELGAIFPECFNRHEQILPHPFNWGLRLAPLSKLPFGTANKTEICLSYPIRCLVQILFHQGPVPSI